MNDKKKCLKNVDKNVKNINVKNVNVRKINV